MIPPTPSPRNRGTALAAVLIVLALLSVSVLGVIVAWGDAAATESNQAQALRARYAAESAAAIATWAILDAQDPPLGPLLIGGASTEVVEVLETLEGYEVTIESVAGNIRRTDRIEVRAE